MLLVASSSCASWLRCSCGGRGGSRWGWGSGWMAPGGGAAVAAALRHRQEGPAGLGARHLDAPRLAVGRRRPRRRLAGVAVGAQWGGPPAALRL